MLDAEPLERTSQLRQMRAIDLAPLLGGVEIMRAAIGVEAHWQIVSAKDLVKRPEARGLALLLDQKRRIDRPVASSKVVPALIRGSDQALAGLLTIHAAGRPDAASSPAAADARACADARPSAALSPPAPPTADATLSRCNPGAKASMASTACDRRNEQSKRLPQFAGEAARLTRHGRS